MFRRESRKRPRRNSQQKDQLAQTTIRHPVVMLIFPNYLETSRFESADVISVQVAEICHHREKTSQLAPIVPSHLLGNNMAAYRQHSSNLPRLQLLMSIDDKIESRLYER